MKNGNSFFVGELFDIKFNLQMLRELFLFLFFRVVGDNDFSRV